MARRSGRAFVRSFVTRVLPFAALGVAWAQIGACNPGPGGGGNGSCPTMTVTGPSAQLDVSSLTFTQTQANETTALLVLLRDATDGAPCTDTLWSNITDGCHVGPFSSTATDDQRWSEIVIPSGGTIASVVAGMTEITSTTVLAPTSGQLSVFIYATEDTSAFTQCATDATCASGRGGSCVGVPGDTAATGGQRFCNGGTVTLVGGACATGAVDSTGKLSVRMTIGAPTVPFNPVCASCPTGKNACAVGCTALTTDPLNCGACDNACNDKATCVGGACVDNAMSCAALNLDATTNYQLCGKTCADWDSDPANCGKCGNACTGSQVCLEGVCTACPAPKAVCAGACVDGSSDMNNCGTCGNACAKGQVCNAGSCAACPSGQINCAASDKTALCITPQSDAVNCGGCGQACVTRDMTSGVVSPDSSSACAGGTCAHLTTCGPGVVVDTHTDANNCGSCGYKCNTSAGQRCSAGQCICPLPNIACGTGDGKSVCTDVTFDNANCGSCGNACVAGSACYWGECSPSSQCPGI